MTSRSQEGWQQVVTAKPRAEDKKPRQKKPDTVPAISAASNSNRSIFAELDRYAIAQQSRPVHERRRMPWAGPSGVWGLQIVRCGLPSTERVQLSYTALKAAACMLSPSLAWGTPLARSGASCMLRIMLYRQQTLACPGLDDANCHAPPS